MNNRLNVKLSSRLFLSLAVYLFLFGFTLRIINLSTTSLWIDDILTYSTLQQADSIDGFLQGMVERKIHVPAYFAVSSLYPGDHSDFSLRYPNVLWSMLAVAVTMRLAGELYHRRELALLVGVLLVIHPHFILVSREARPYPMSILFVTVSSYVFLRWLSYKTNRTRYTLFFWFVSTITYLTHYATLVLIPAQLIYLLWRRYTQQSSTLTLFIWFALQAIAVIPTILWEVVLLAPRRSASVLEWVAPMTIGGIAQGIFQLYLGLFSTYLPTIFQLMALLLGLLGFLLYIRGTRYGLYWVLLTIVPIVGLVVVSQIRPLFYPRYLSVTQSIYLLTLIIGWWQLWRHLGKYRLMQWGLVLVVGLSIVNALTFSAQQFQTQSYARREWREAMAYIEQNAQPDDVIITHPSYVRAPEHYQTREDLIILQPDEVNQLLYAPLADDPPFDRMWFIITPEGFQLEGIARYYGVDEEHRRYSTQLLLVDTR